MDKFVLYLIGTFFVLGGIDYILGSPLKIGGKFEEGIKTMGALGLGMIGIYSLAPILSNILSVMIVPVSKVLKLDPSIIPSAFLAVDMGGYQIAGELALTKEMGLFSGIIIASTLGATISFSIPVAIGMISKEDEKYFSKGVMIGITSIPFGCLAAGIWNHINIGTLLWNLLPIFIFSILLGIGLLKWHLVF
jgi:ethanolamine transporter